MNKFTQLLDAVLFNKNLSYQILFLFLLMFLMNIIRN